MESIGTKLDEILKQMRSLDERIQKLVGNRIVLVTPSPGERVPPPSQILQENRNPLLKKGGRLEMESDLVIGRMIHVSGIRKRVVVTYVEK